MFIVTKNLMELDTGWVDRRSDTHPKLSPLMYLEVEWKW